MWNSAVNLIVEAVVSCFNWLEEFLSAIPGSWDTLFTIIVLFILSRFLLGPLLGAAFCSGSDQAKIARYRKENRLRNKAKEK